MQHRKISGRDIVEEITRARPVLDVVAGEIDTLATAAEAALKDSGLPVFQRGASLVVPVSHDVPAAGGKMTVAAGLKELSTPGLIDHMAQSACFQHWNMRSKKMVPRDPPAQVASIILSRSGKWTFPNIAGVITTPTMRPDGSILTEPGYDGATRLYHIADPTLRLPAIPFAPSKVQAVRALERLNGLLEEFNFVAAVDRAVALSGLITPTLRGMLSVSPMHAITASTAGSGKSYVVDIASGISTGRPCPALTPGDRDDETEKRLVGMLLAAFPILSLDNVNGELGGDLLCQAIERPLVRVRALGASDIMEIESRATIFANGNGLRVRGDMTRRTIVCRLDSNMERPELREFKSDPLQSVLDDRGAYVAACLTIVRAYLAAGSPGKLKPVASFADWSNTVRCALVWLDHADPVETMETARADDPELAELKQVIGAWHASYGDAPLTVRTVAEHALEKRPDEFGEWAPANPALRDAIQNIAGDRGTINTRRFGQWLLRHEGRIVRVADNDNANPKTLRFKRQGVVGGVAVWKCVQVV